MPIDDQGSVAIVTVTYNSSGHLRDFLASIASTDAAGILTVVADNDSADVDATAALCFEAGATLLRVGANLGYGGAMNRAIQSLPASVDFVVICNPDVRLTAGSIGALVAAAASDVTVGSAGPRILNEDGTTYPSARSLPSLRTGVGHALFAGVWPTNPWTRSYHRDEADPDVGRDTGWLSGSCVLVRRSAFDSLDGFDEGFFMYFEDVDLGYRLIRAGWRNRFVPESRVVHTGGHSTASDSSNMLRVHHASAYRYLSKKYSHPVLAPLRLAIWIGLHVRSWSLSRVPRRRG